MDAPRLDIYITRHCFGCSEAVRLADAVAARFAAVSVRVIDLEREPEARPGGLVAVPTYLLNGRVISLGNPREMDLVNELEQALRIGRAEGASRGPR